MGTTTAREQGRQRRGNGDNTSEGTGTTTTTTTSAPRTTAASSCSRGGNRCCYKTRERQRRRGGGSKETRPKGRRSTSLGLLVSFSFFSFHYFIANKHFYTGFIYVTTTLQAPGRDDETAKGRPTTTTRRGDGERRKEKKAQGTSSTSLGQVSFCFFFLISLFLLTNFFKQ